MKYLAGAAMAALMIGGCAADARQPADLAWLSGYWVKCEDGLQVTETWSASRDGMMVGTNFTSGGGKPTWEFLRIGANDADGAVAYFAQPAGQPVTAFPLAPAASGPAKAVFENLAHEFPHPAAAGRNAQAVVLDVLVKYRDAAGPQHGRDLVDEECRR